MIPNTLPLGLVDNPRLEQWIGFEQPGRVRVATGKVELGQGILTAIVQIAAEELDVDVSRIAIVSGDTLASPHEGVTAGSLSIQNSGGSVRLVGAEVRAMMLAAAADRLGCPTAVLDVVDGVIRRDGAPTGLDYWLLAPSLDLSRVATGSVPVKPATAHRVIGTSLPRVDLPTKILARGAAFVHDQPAARMHARPLRQPWPDATLQGPSQTDMMTLVAPGVRVVQLGDFIAVVAATERAATAAADKLAPRLRWTGGKPIADDTANPGWVATQPATDTADVRGSAPSGPTMTVSRRYTKPFIAHASIAPSCSLAHFDGSRLTVWTHSQGVVPLRGSLSRALKIAPEHIHVIHVAGAGCYGHNGADDVACDAAVIAMQMPGETVRVQWSRADELSCAPFGSAMVVRIDADVTLAGKLASWTTHIWSGPHALRPGANGGVNLLAADAMPNPPPRPMPQELPESVGASATRNAWLLYDVPHQALHNHVVADVGPRTSSMRGLGAFANVFAIECFIDEQAADAGIDPVAYRLAMMSDPRARAVIERAAAMANWQAGHALGSGRGRGFAYSRYKNRAGYLALVVDVSVDVEVRLDRIWCAADAGLAINPDGIRNQIEGGIIQAASWTLKEQISFADGRVATRSWADYPILRFSEVPEIAIDVLARPDDPPLGMGEVAQGPTGAAIGNAVAAALGVRIYDLPLTRERLMATALS